MKSLIAIIIIASFVFYLFTKKSNNKKSQVNNALATEFLLNNKSDPDVIETTTGLQYQILSKSENTAKPLGSDRVTVHYHGTLLDGTVFDSSVNRGEPISFSLNQVIPGWTEGLQLMNEGDKFKFFIPSRLGYGNRSAGKIPPGALLIFEVELLNIN